MPFDQQHIAIHSLHLLFLVHVFNMHCLLLGNGPGEFRLVLEHYITSASDLLARKCLGRNVQNASSSSERPEVSGQRNQMRTASTRIQHV